MQLGNNRGLCRKCINYEPTENQFIQHESGFPKYIIYMSQRVIDRNNTRNLVKYMKCSNLYNTVVKVNMIIKLPNTISRNSRNKFSMLIIMITN